MSFVRLPRLVFPTPLPLFCHHKGAINETRFDIQTAAFLEIPSQSLQDGFHHPSADPALASLVWRISLWQVFPRRTGLQTSEDGVQYLPWIFPGAFPLARWGAFLLWQKRFQHSPLLVCQIHRSPLSSW